MSGNEVVADAVVALSLRLVALPAIIGWLSLGFDAPVAVLVAADDLLAEEKVAAAEQAGCLLLVVSRRW